MASRTTNDSSNPNAEVLHTDASGGGGGGTVNQGTAGASSWKVVEDNSAGIKTDLDAIAASVANIPSSPATSAKQDTGNTALASIATSVAGVLDSRDLRDAKPSSFWTAIHVPSSNTKATATKASAGAGVRNVCTGFTATIAADATAPTAVNLIVSLIDGSSGGITYLWRSTISLPAVAGAQISIVRGSLWIPGSQATAMTLEFSAAGGADTIESVSMEGTTITE